MNGKQFATVCIAFGIRWNGNNAPDNKPIGIKISTCINHKLPSEFTKVEVIKKRATDITFVANNITRI